jgi:membrane protease YdiL (CAAX protease family)
MTITAWIRRHPVAAYFFLAYAISWLGVAAVLGPRFLRGEQYEPAAAVLALLAMLAGPFGAGLGLTAVVDGREGLRALWARMTRWRVGGRWYAVALLLFPALILAVLFLLSRLISPQFAPGFLMLGVVYGLLAGFFEETGWMGYAFPKMRARQGALAAALTLGVLWGQWHIVADYLGSSHTLGLFWAGHFAAMWLAGMTAVRVLIVWVYANTGSLLLAQLMHASSTGFLVLLSPVLIAPAETLWYIIYASVLWVVVGIVLAVYGKTLVRGTAGGRST